MGSNAFFTVAYKILSSLKYCYEHGEQPDPGVINERTLLISKAQYVEILRMLSDHNYIEGVTFTHTKEGVLYSFQDARITIEGLEYLAENSMMQKAFRIFKSFKEWL